MTVGTTRGSTGMIHGRPEETGGITVARIAGSGRNRSEANINMCRRFCRTIAVAIDRAAVVATGSALMASRHCGSG